MLLAIGCISFGRLSGTPATHCTKSTSVMRQASSSDMPRSFGARARRTQAAAAAVRADIQPEEFLHALHARFILDLGERVFDRSDGAVIGKTSSPA